MSLAGNAIELEQRGRRRARKRLMAAEMEATTKLQTSGGKKPRKTAVRKRYRQDLQKKIQQRRRHREVNRQIWVRL